MKINHANAHFTASHQRRETFERLEASERRDNGLTRRNISAEAMVREVSSSFEFRASSSANTLGAAPSNDVVAMPEEDDIVDLDYMVIKRLVQMLTGKEVKLFDPSQLQADNTTVSESPISQPTQGTNEGQQTQQAAASQLFFQRYTDSERMSFKAALDIKTADGRNISIDFELDLARQFVEERLVMTRQDEAPLTDPLVINYDRQSAGLESERIAFDVNADGEMDNMPVLKEGSAYLALDKNNNQVIDDGNELFGTHSGNGFLDLSTYDEDGNGFIDEGDSVFSRLQLWHIDAEGEQRLMSLEEMNIGALYLKSINSPFMLTDEDNNVLGVIRQTGLALLEDGDAITMQQVDLSI